MGQGFLIDTNAVIDHMGNTLPEKGASFMNTLVPQISVITQIELLGWYQAPSEALKPLTVFVQDAYVHPLDELVISKTIELRQKHKIKTPDAIIAATALVQAFVLVTRNTNDFKDIEGLQCINPWTL